MTGHEIEKRLCLIGKRFLADIQIDATIYYPWIKRNIFGVFPELGALDTFYPFTLF